MGQIIKRKQTSCWQHNIRRIRNLNIFYKTTNIIINRKFGVLPWSICDPKIKNEYINKIFICDHLCSGSWPRRLVPCDRGGSRSGGPCTPCLRRPERSIWSCRTAWNTRSQERTPATSHASRNRPACDSLEKDRISSPSTRIYRRSFVILSLFIHSFFIIFIF